MSTGKAGILRFGALAGIALLLGAATAGADSGRTALDRAASEYLRAQLEVIPCGPDRFVYGVGYIDGSYMERVFLVKGADGGPQSAVMLGDEAMWPETDDDDLPAELAARSFSLELEVPEARHAVPGAGGWVAADTAWERALRFKYYHWFGDVSRQAGEWRIDWQGYRKPMLPAGFASDFAAACGIFEAE